MHHHRIHHQWYQLFNLPASRPEGAGSAAETCGACTTFRSIALCCLTRDGTFFWNVPPGKLTWLDGRSTMNEDVFPIENGDVQCHVSFWVGIFLIRFLSSKKSSHMFLLPFPGEEKTRNNSTISSPPNPQIANFPTSQPRKLRKKSACPNSGCSTWDKMQAFAVMIWCDDVMKAAPFSLHRVVFILESRPRPNGPNKKWFRIHSCFLLKFFAEIAKLNWIMSMSKVDPATFNWRSKQLATRRFSH